ncbi:MAG: translation initiation factor IF-2 subunit alpha [Promethearchaeota archaeon]
MTEESGKRRSSKASLPEVGDLVVATVTRITAHGAYASLDEFKGHECFIHISEIASTWVRNIRNFVRENQKIVAKVLRVDARRGQVDMSLRRVTKEQSRMKIQEWKRAQRGIKLLSLAAEKMDKTLDEAQEIAGKPITQHFTDILEALEKAKEAGPKILTAIGVPKKWAEYLHELALAHVIVREVSVEKTLKLVCLSKEGVEGVRKALLAAEKIVGPNGGEVFLEGAPRYRVRVKAKNYKLAEEILDRAITESLKVIKACGGEGQVATS